MAESVLGRCLAGMGRYEDAEALLLDSYGILIARKGETARETLNVLRRIASLYEDWGRPEEVARFRALLSEDDR